MLRDSIGLLRGPGGSYLVLRELRALLGYLGNPEAGKSGYVVFLGLGLAEICVIRSQRGNDRVLRVFLH